MFGYIKVERDELRVREYEYYKATYCGLCRSMGKCTGQCSRMLLSYDFTFLAGVRMALCGEKPQFKRRRCIAHPLRRRSRNIQWSNHIRPNTVVWDSSTGQTARLEEPRCHSRRGPTT